MTSLANKVGIVSGRRDRHRQGDRFGDGSGRCLACHRHPEQNLREKEDVYNMDWRPPADQFDRGVDLVKKYEIESLTHCSTCHR